MRWKRPVSEHRPILYFLVRAHPGARRCHKTYQVCSADSTCPPPFSADISHEGCGLVNGPWNVPSGGLVVLRSRSGPVKALMGAIGEYYTHSMLSTGSGAIHSELFRPPDPPYYTCAVPVVRTMSFNKGFQEQSSSISGRLTQICIKDIRSAYRTSMIQLNRPRKRRSPWGAGPRQPYFERYQAAETIGSVHWPILRCNETGRTLPTHYINIAILNKQINGIATPPMEVFVLRTCRSRTCVGLARWYSQKRTHTRFQSMRRTSSTTVLPRSAPTPSGFGKDLPSPFSAHSLPSATTQGIRLSTVWP